MVARGRLIQGAISGGKWHRKGSSLVCYIFNNLKGEMVWICNHEGCSSNRLSVNSVRTFEDADELKVQYDSRHMVQRIEGAPVECYLHITLITLGVQINCRCNLTRGKWCGGGGGSSWVAWWGLPGGQCGTHKVPPHQAQCTWVYLLPLRYLCTPATKRPIPWVPSYLDWVLKCFIKGRHMLKTHCIAVANRLGCFVCGFNGVEHASRSSAGF